MRWNTLSETIEALAASVTPDVEGLTVTEAEIAVPLEVRLVRTSNGDVVVLAQPGHSRWVSGFLPPTHPMRLRLSLESGDAR